LATFFPFRFLPAFLFDLQAVTLNDEIRNILSDCYIRRRFCRHVLCRALKSFSRKTAPSHSG
jgi:hypothetical protein